jgi:GH24 family phage-related lysozyme (muramidase)
MNNFEKLIYEVLTEAKRETIAVDLDATLAHYSHWKGPTKIGKPVPKMVERIHKWIKDGKKVIIFTARANDKRSIQAIKKWLKENNLPALKITNIKTPDITEIWDDRAVPIEKNTGMIKNVSENLNELILASLLGITSPTQMQHNTQPQKIISSQSVTQNNNQQIRDFITKHEGKRYKAYKDSKGILTIGIGFNLERNNAKKRLEEVGANYDAIVSGKASLTDSQVNKLFDKEYNDALNIASKFVSNFSNLPHDAKMVLTDMAFNLGPNRLNKFQRFKSALEREDFKEAAREMQNSAWYKQVRNRGIENVKIMNELS